MGHAGRFGLWLNLPRQRARHAWAGKEAIELAMGRGRVPRLYFEAVCATEAQAEELAFRVNTARKEKEALASLKGGPAAWQGAW